MYQFAINHQKTQELPFKGILRTAASREIGQCQGREKRKAPAEAPWPQGSGLHACSGGWKQAPSLERRLFLWTLFTICFPRVFLHEMEILTLSEAMPNWESSFSVTYGRDF